MCYICTIYFWNERMKSCDLHQQLVVVMLSKISVTEKTNNTQSPFKLFLLGYRNGSVVKSIFCSCRGPTLNSQYTQGISKPPATPFSEDSTPSSGLCRLLQPCDIMHELTKGHTYIWKQTYFLVSDLGKVVWACNSTTWELKRGRRMEHWSPA